MATENVPFKPHFGAFVLETLTLGMYGESRNAIREYIQNGFDSLRQAVADHLISDTEAKIEIVLDDDLNGLTIRDNGGGLRTENAVSVLASVGASNKDYRRNAGFRGIGRLAGIVFCDTLSFTTKAVGQTRRTVVTFDARKLREKMSPEASTEADAAQTLESCVTAKYEDDPNAMHHFFEVSLRGFFNPPLECRSREALKTFVSQVSPLPYSPEFPHGDAILERARGDNFPIEWVRVFLQGGDAEFEELFKPYGKDFGVKNERVPITIDYVASPRGKWWGWVGRKRVSGAIKDVSSKGIRVRVRNIQIDGTDIIRDILAVSHLGGKPRTSYSRFVDWYVGEIHIRPNAAIPNARRDGFEEDPSWQAIRNELDELVATKYGKLAYKTSKADQLSIDSLNKRLIDFRRTADSLVAQRRADWDVVSQAISEANELQNRLSKAVKVADEGELASLRSIAETVSVLKKGLNGLAVDPPAHKGCEEEVAVAISDFTQELYRALKQRLSPADWQRARDIVREISGEDPS
ncbi:ATP-binding protein [Methylobacterium sp. JK268]